MSSIATFRNKGLSTSFNAELEHSALSLDWVMLSGIPAAASSVSGLLPLPCADDFLRPINVDLMIAADLPSDLLPLI
ncbi:hypothetical protein B0H14DRAFT_3436599 [Mycena olivaceomarginata]|nr:hypothetical protein B0H14DRAFT_3436599 [Mycena olivaceomarginata]